MALLTEGGFPYPGGDIGRWCDRLVRGLGAYQFDVYALGHAAQRKHDAWAPLPGNVHRVHAAAPWPAPETVSRARHGRRARRRFAECYGELVAAVCAGEPTLGEHGGDGAWRPVRAGQGGTEPAVRRIWGARVGRRAARDERAVRDGHGMRVPVLDVPALHADAGTAAVSAADRFAGALYELASFARDEGTPAALLRSEAAVRAWEHACRAPGAPSAVRAAPVADLLTVADTVERLLWPLSLDWYGADALGSADLCHATSGGAAALAGLLARHYWGVPLLLTEHDMVLRSHYLTRTAASGPVRTLVAAFHGHLAAETYRRAVCITSGSARTRHWQERYGAARGKLRTVHPGMDAAPFAGTGESDAPGEDGTLVWAGRIEPGKDLDSLLHAFVRVRRALPRARLRIVGEPAPGADATAYAAHCRALAAQLFPAGTAEGHGAGEPPVSFEGAGGEGGQGDGVPDGGGAGGVRGSAGGTGDGLGEAGAGVGGMSGARLAACYAAGSVVVRSSIVEGFPTALVAAMLCGRATVSTDAGQVADVVGRTGLVVPPGDPRALAEACLSLLRDPDRRALLGAAARARALELFTVEQNIAAFDRIYQDIADSCPAPGRRSAASTAVRRASSHQGLRVVRPGPGASAEGVLGARLHAAPVGEGAR